MCIQIEQIEKIKNTLSKISTFPCINSIMYFYSFIVCIIEKKKYLKKNLYCIYVIKWISTHYTKQFSIIINFYTAVALCYNYTKYVESEFSLSTFCNITKKPNMRNKYLLNNILVYR